MKTSLYVGAPLGVLVAIAQSAVAPRIRLFGVGPDWVLVFAVSWVLLHGTREGILVGLVGGVALDALSGASFGLATISLTLVTGLAGFGEANIFRTAWFLPYITIGIATLVYDGLFLFLMRMTGRVVMWWPMLWRVVLPAVVINTVCMTVVYRLAGWLGGRAGPPSVEWQ